MILTTIGKLVVWFIQKIGALTLLSLVLLIGIFSILIYGLINSVRGMDFTLLLPLAFLGLLFGWWLGRINVAFRGAVILTVIFGIGIVLFRVGRLGDQLITFLRALVYIQIHDQPWQVEWMPVWEALSNIATSITTLITRASNWTWRITSGQQAFDPIAIALVWSLVIWGLAVWAGWSVRRWRHPLLGIVPAGALLAGILNYVNGNYLILLPLIGGTLLLIALIWYGDREKSWQARGIDYSEELRLEYFLVSSGLAIVIISLSSLAPSLSVQKIAHYARELTQGNSGKTNPVAESFGLHAGEGYDDNFYGLYAAGLPRIHLLGSGPELSEEIVMLVEINNLSSSTPDDLQTHLVPRTYWRSLTYDRYLGSGWSTRKTKTIDYPANQAAYNPEILNHIAISPNQRFVLQSVKGKEELGGLLYHAGRLITANHDYQVAWRTPPIDQGSGDQANSTDMFGATINANIYQTSSVVLNIGVAQLRTAGEDYPDWMSEKYLSLPDNLPDRVISLALDLTATQPTSYDRAKAIESYLRDFPYTLDLSTPPANRDVVDYFLFELKQGYCDYYASAMVVLARAAGLPARLVIGYAGGRYDPSISQYIVTAADAHSWPEVYFPNIGWIEFEPTAGLPPLHRPEDIPPGEIQDYLSELQLTTEGSRRSPLNKLITWTGGIIAITFFIYGAWLIADSWRLHQVESTAAVSTLYRRLYRAGRKITISTKKGVTPLEFAASLLDQVISLSEGNRWEEPLSPTSQEVHQLTNIYSQTIYSQHPPMENDRIQAIQTWGRLRFRLLLARLLGMMRPSSKPHSTSQDKKLP